MSVYVLFIFLQLAQTNCAINVEFIQYCATLHCILGNIRHYATNFVSHRIPLAYFISLWFKNMI